MIATLTILLTSYNYSQYLGGALEAILQNKEEFELIAIDDGSTDCSIDIINWFAVRDPRVRLVPNKKNRGIHYSLNKGIDLAQGRYLLCAAADDRILPGLIPESVAMLEEHPHAGVCTAPVRFIDPEGKHFGSWNGPELKNRQCLSREAVQEIMRRHGFWYTGASTVFRLDMLKAAGGFPSELGTLVDSFITQEVALRHGLCTLSSPLAEVRVDANSYSGTARRNLAVSHAERAEALKRMRAEPNLFSAEFVEAWDNVWAFMDAIQVWRGTILAPQQQLLEKDLKLFRPEPAMFDRIGARLLSFVGVMTFFLFGLWGAVSLCRYPLFWQYLRPGRLLRWVGRFLRA